MRLNALRGAIRRGWTPFEFWPHEGRRAQAPGAAGFPPLLKHSARLADPFEKPESVKGLRSAATAPPARNSTLPLADDHRRLAKRQQTYV